MVALENFFKLHCNHCQCFSCTYHIVKILAIKHAKISNRKLHLTGKLYAYTKYIQTVFKRHESDFLTYI